MLLCAFTGPHNQDSSWVRVQSIELVWVPLPQVTGHLRLVLTVLTVRIESLRLGNVLLVLFRAN